MDSKFADLPSLSSIIEYTPVDLSLAINPQEMLLTNGQPLQEEMATPEEDQSQLYDTIQNMYEWQYSSDAYSSCYAGEDETSWVVNQESNNIPEAEPLYTEFYTFNAESIREPDTTALAPPLLRDPSLFSVFENCPSPDCCTTDLDLSIDVFEADWEPMQVWEHTLSVEDALSEEVALSGEEVHSEEEEVVVPKKAEQKTTRKNYDEDTICILMDWYFKNNGMVPTNTQKKMLAAKTGKSEAQIFTWYQNAKRRHIYKLQKYKELALKYPDSVYDYCSFKSFTELKK